MKYLGFKMEIMCDEAYAIKGHCIANPDDEFNTIFFDIIRNLSFTINGGRMILWRIE